MKLKIITWNIAYGYGLGSEGANETGTGPYVQRPKDFFVESLARIRDVILQEKPDLVLLQETDFSCKRSGFTEQADYLARSTDLLYSDLVVSWNHPYVPYPGLKPKNHFGRVKSGGAILSRFPLTCVHHELLPKPREHSKLYNFFYLHRYLQIVRVNLPDVAFNIMNLHLDAYSDTNRELHMIRTQDRMKDFDVWIAGGDFNGNIELKPEFLSTGYSAQPAPTATFPSNDPSRILDGFITDDRQLKITGIRTLSTSQLSDHYPVVIECVI